MKQVPWLVAFLVAPAAAQDAPVVRLSKPTAVVSEAFSEIAGMRELPDGRVIVVDTRERVLKVADLDRDAVVQIGRTGDGPGEYRAPIGIFRLPGDSSVVFDGGATRLLFLDPIGRPGTTLSLAALRASAAGIISRFVPTRGDAAGRLYGSGAGVRMTSRGPALADSVAIVRLSRGSSELEELAFLRVRSLADRGGDVDPERAVFMTVIPFVVGDQWAVDADGRIAILPYDVYRVDYVDSLGVRRAGPALPFDRLRVSEGHKAQWRRDASAGGRATEPPRWPEFLPPFLNRPAQFAPDGMLWVLRTGPAEAPPTYDVIDPEGRLTQRVIVPVRGRIVGFGARSVYVSVRDDDDLQYLQRYALP